MLLFGLVCTFSFIVIVVFFCCLFPHLPIVLHVLFFGVRCPFLLALMFIVCSRVGWFVVVACMIGLFVVYVVVVCCVCAC